MADPALEREAHAVGHLLALEQREVQIEPALVLLDLRLGQGPGVGAAEQLQQAGVAELVEVGGGVIAPAVEGFQAAVGERVEAAAAAGLLAPLLEQSGLGEPASLGVYLRVRERPEVEDADRGSLLELVRGDRLAALDQAKHGVGGVGEARV